MGETVLNKKMHCLSKTLVSAMLVLAVSLVAGCQKSDQSTDLDTKSISIEENDISTIENSSADSSSTDKQIPDTVRAVLFPEETRPNLENFAYGASDFFGSSADELIQIFGDPFETRERQIKNLHYPEYRDMVVEMGFRNLKVILYRVNENVMRDREILTRVDVAGNWKDPNTGLGIGISREDVRSIIGHPDKSEKGTDTYSVNNDDVSPPDVLISYKDDKVVSIRWQYYID